MYILPAERWLNHRARPTPNVSIADNQTVTKQHLDPLESRPFAVLAVVFDQELSHLSGIVDEYGLAPVLFFQANKITVLRLQVLQQCQRIRIDAQRLRLLWTGRVAHIGVW